MEVKYNFDISIGAILTVIFIALKLTHFIDWSWLWVFSPLWISAIIGLVVLGIITIFFNRF